jgi:iron complex outermembrane receptor protein
VDRAWLRTGADVFIPEESLDNLELGFKGRLWDGRATLTAAIYKGEWRDQHTRGIALCTLPDGTFALNDTEILVRDCADCLTILGDRDGGAIGNEFSRSPKQSGTLAASYRRAFNNKFDWFARADYLYKGTQWATDANVTETGVRNRVNLRIGVNSEGLRIEGYVTNLFEDKTFTGYQRLNDFAFPDTVPGAGVGYNYITAGLPDKRAYGVRVSYSFDFNN